MAEEITLTVAEATVVTASDYEQLENLPTLEGTTITGDLTLNDVHAYTQTEVDTLLNGKADTSDIPSLTGYATESYVDTAVAGVTVDAYTKAQTDTLLSAKANSADLATVATSGSYNDLSDKPTIPSAITVDTYLSSSSTNPVQNKVIASRINALASDVNKMWPKANVTTYGTTDGDAYVPTCGAVRSMVFGQGVAHVYASNSTVQAMLAQMGTETTVVKPSTLIDVMTFMLSEYACPYNMLCWQNGNTLELARVFASIDLTTQKATAYARGRTSIASGIIGEDDSWTVTAL